MDACLPGNAPAYRSTSVAPSAPACAGGRRAVARPGARRIGRAAARRVAVGVLLALAIGPRAVAASDAAGTPAGPVGSPAGAQHALPPAAAAPATPPATRLAAGRTVVQPGRVVGVLDGDTLDLLTPQRRAIRVRLSGIDAPERRQAFGQVARERLAERVFGEEVRVEIVKSDRFGRSVGRVLDADGDVNLAMIEGGWAWHFERYAHEQPAAERRAYAAAQRRARDRGDGLWADPHAIAPWDWRASRGQRADQRPPAHPD